MVRLWIESAEYEKLKVADAVPANADA